MSSDRNCSCCDLLGPHTGYRLADLSDVAVAPMTAVDAAVVLSATAPPSASSALLFWATNSQIHVTGL